MKLTTEQDIEEILVSNIISLKKLSGKNVLLTGAAGFLGRYFLETFRKFNETNPPIKIVALDNHITSLQNSESFRITDRNIEWIYGDAKIGAELPNRFDYIIHSAGIASPAHYRAKPLETVYVAVDVTRLLLEKARKDNARMLFFSSSEIYGDPDSSNIPTNEDYRGNVTSRGPRACYDESKRLGETLCYIYQTEFSTHVSVVRPFNVYGPGMLPTDFRVLPNFANAIYNNEEIRVYGSGNQTRTFCYITDAISAFLQILTLVTEPDVFNVGNPSPEISMNDLAKIAKQVVGYKGSAVTTHYPATYPADEPNRRCPDISKITNVIGFKPKVELEDGLKRFFNWTQNNYGKL